MGALSNAEVANYLNQHFVCSFQKVGNFQIVNGQKQGGNVASYFTLDDGRVLHVLAGPVNANMLLREAHWVVETRKLGIMTSRGDKAKYQASWRKAHAERLQAEHGVVGNFRSNGRYGSSGYLGFNAANHPPSGLAPQGQAHWLLAKNPLIPIDQIYRDVFEKILREKISTRPVDGEVASQASGSSVRFRKPPGSDLVLAETGAADIPSVDGEDQMFEGIAADDEETASRRLKLAKFLASDSKHVKNSTDDHRDGRDPDRLQDLAYRHFREIAKDYPQTKAAREARRLLGEE